MLKVVRFRLRPEGYWLTDASARIPSATIVVSSVYVVDGMVHLDLMVHAADGDAIDAFQEDGKQDDRVAEVRRVYEGDQGTRFHVTYGTEFSFYPHIIEHTPVSLGAIRVADGVEHYEIIGEIEDLRALLDTLEDEGPMEVDTIRSVGPGAREPDDDLPMAAALTDKQIDTLLLAHADGYYQWPRDQTASDLAQKTDLSLSAFLDRLRRAESKVLDRFVEEVKDRDPARYNAARARLRNAEPDRRSEVPAAGGSPRGSIADPS